MSKWISVKDKLPTNDDDYLVYPPPNPEYGILTANFNPFDGDYKGEWTWEDNHQYGCDTYRCRVTHYQPIPEPPEDV